MFKFKHFQDQKERIEVIISTDSVERDRSEFTPSLIEAPGLQLVKFKIVYVYLYRLYTIMNEGRKVTLCNIKGVRFSRACYNADLG